MRPKPKRLILNLLLAAEGEPLSARDAVTACGLFGVSESSARVTLARLSAEGLIQARGRGLYQLGDKAQTLAEDVRAWRHAEARLGEWHGDWVAVHCAGLGRSDRSALRQRERALHLNGFRELEKDLYLRPDNLKGGTEGVRARLHKLGLEPEAAVFQLRELDPRREERARALWDGEALDRYYREARQKLDDWLAGATELEPEEAARESFVLGDDAIRRIVFDPLLPEPLVDTAARHAFIQAMLRFDAAGHEIWRRLYTAATAGPGQDDHAPLRH